MAQPVRPLTAPPAEDPGIARKSVFREYAEAFIVAIFLAVVLRTFFLQAYKIPSGSMEQTLLIGDHIIVNKLIYGFRMPDSLFGLTPLADRIPYGQYLFQLEPVHRGDIIVFVYPDNKNLDFIKRVVGLPGDVVAVREGNLYLDGVLVKPPPGTHYKVAPEDRDVHEPRDSMQPRKLGPDEYFMMGDNRDNSDDSRFWGPISRNAVEGRAMFIYWSCDDDATPLTCLWDVRWSRLLNIVR